MKLYSYLIYLSLSAVLLASLQIVVAQYDEKYRPQFHFTPKIGWIGDPDGLFKYRGIYYLFWWGHAYPMILYIGLSYLIRY